MLSWLSCTAQDCLPWDISSVVGWGPHTSINKAIPNKHSMPTDQSDLGISSIQAFLEDSRLCQVDRHGAWHLPAPSLFPPLLGYFLRAVVLHMVYAQEGRINVSCNIPFLYIGSSVVVVITASLCPIRMLLCHQFLLFTDVKLLNRSRRFPWGH